MQLRLALNSYIEICEMLGRGEQTDWALAILHKLDADLQQHAWDGEWFLRGFRFDGVKFGSHECDEGKIFLNPQTWAVISGAASPAQAETAMAQVRQTLATEYGIMLCAPPYTSGDYTIVRAQLMNPGSKENGGIFIHTQGWAIMAEVMLGHGDRAFDYLKAYLPGYFNEHAELREIEPYVVCQSTHSRFSRRFGASRIPWLSGSATWTYHAMTQYILGIRPDYHGITIDPCIPSSWDGFTVQRSFRGRKLAITVENPQKKERGVLQLMLNGQILPGAFIAQELLQPENDIRVRMG
jgi:cellobiose phosphorylase